MLIDKDDDDRDDLDDKDDDGETPEAPEKKGAPESAELDGAEPDLDKGKDGEEEEEEFKKLTPKQQESVNRRIGKITAKAKAYEKELKELRERLNTQDEAARTAEDAKYAHLQVLPEYFTAEDRSRIDALEKDISEAAKAADSWEAVEEDVEVRGKTYTQKEALKMAAQARKAEGRAQGALDAIVEAAKRKQTEDIRRGRAQKSAKPPEADPEKPEQKPRKPGASAPPSPSAKPADRRGAPTAAPVKTQKEAKAWLHEI